MARFPFHIKSGSLAAAVAGLMIQQLSPPSLRAASISADITTGFRSTSNGGGTSALFTYSLLTSVGGVATPAGPNATSVYYSYPIATGGKTIMDPVPVAAGVAIATPRGLFGWGTPVTYAPVVGVNNRPKTVYCRQSLLLANLGCPGGNTPPRQCRLAREHVSLL